MSRPNVRATNLKGDNGGVYLLGAGAIALPSGVKWFEAIIAHAASVVTVTSNLSGITTNVNLPAGFIWYGHFTVLTVVSGEVTAYSAT